ncbi:MAG: sugar phosphate isomerase/epimerase, partial [Acidobacteria bacterium]|nr:sugar phosphate isomerase/epimerase [Acidobacteriota bacterium]
AKAAGYECVELCSFKGYAKQGFGPLADMKPPEIRKIIKDAGLTAPSSHFNYPEFADSAIGQSIEWAHGVGLKYMVLSMARMAKTMDEWKVNFDLMNKCGERVRKAGMIFGYHTHADEWNKINGVMVFDELLRQVDAKNCVHQLDLFGTFLAGLDAGDYMSRHPGRFFSLHMKDTKKPAPPPPEQATAAGGRGRGGFPAVLPVGQGDIDWKAIYAGAKKGGVKLSIVEMEVRPSEDPMAAMKLSADYLRKLKV